uniref:Uncharacterized protein n=1 Tax=Arundo donax TaxID=35708 RepID=A0A0A9DDW3_ARUDO
MVARRMRLFTARWWPKLQRERQKEWMLRRLVGWIAAWLKAL